MDPAIIEHYESHDEQHRLAGESIEKIRTKEIVSRFLPDKPLTVLDMGGAAGVYSFWLAKAGHAVHLVDPTPKHIELARRTQLETGIALASATVGDASHIPFPDETFDAVLYFGPLYHLVDRSERISVLREALRAMRRGGFIFGAAISRYASAIDGFLKNWLTDADYAKIMRRDLTDGQHRTAEGKDFFTTSFFHSPGELREEVEAAGFFSTEVFAVESLSEIVPDLEVRMHDAAYRETMLRIIRSVEQDPDIMGFTAHLLAVARKSL